LAAAGGYSGHKVVRWLIEKYGIDEFVHQTDNSGRTALILAAPSKATSKTVELLIKNGVPYTQTHQSSTVLDITAKECSKSFRWILANCPVTKQELKQVLKVKPKLKNLIYFHLHWKKLRLVFIGIDDKDCVLSKLPREVVQLVVLFLRQL